MINIREIPLTDAEKVVYATTYALELHRKTTAGVESYEATADACTTAFDAVVSLRAARGRVDRYGDDAARAKMFDQIAASEEE